MDGRAVQDVMTGDVVVVHPDTPFKSLVQVLVGGGLDAVPVVDERGALRGIVSRADLTCHEQEPPSVAELLLRGHARQVARKGRGRTARDLMSSPVRTTSPGTPVGEALHEMARAGVGRLVVVRAGRVVGILTRSDVLRVFLRSDAELEQEARAAVEAAVGCPREVAVAVADGVVHLRGWVERASCAWAACAAAHAVPGVVEVVDDLTAAVDDTVVHELSVRGPFV